MKIDRDAPVGVFDSGIGGLTVAREIMRNLPAEKIVYFFGCKRVNVLFKKCYEIILILNIHANGIIAAYGRNNIFNGCVTGK